MTDFLGLAGRTVVVTGLANKKSVAWHVGRGLEQAGATPVWLVHTERRRDEVRPWVGARDVLVCDVERDEEIERAAAELAERHPRIDGLVHSIAFADYSGGPRAFHETDKRDFLRSMDVSCFSLVKLVRALRELFSPRASIVTLSISTTTMAAENYGLMAPVKAALDSAVVFLAKSLSRSSEVRVNAVRAGLLKTAASAGIPGYLESWLFAESATLRRRGLATREVADTVLFLLSERSSGINAQGIVVDAGMGVNFFDSEIVRRATAGEPEP